MSEKLKILVCGDVEGRFKTLFNRVENINKKSGPFDMLLCVGNFFGVNNVEFEDYKNCSKMVPVPTYILGPNKEEHLQYFPDGCTELCYNVSFLGKRGFFISGGGLKIAYLSGVPSSTKASKFEFDKKDCFTLKDSIIRGQPNFRGIDILLTSSWPKHVSDLDENSNAPKPEGSELISWLAYQLKPRYHIAGLEGVFYERVPYRNISSSGDLSGEIATRFLGMARVGNPQKQTWIYALSLMPVEKMRLKELYEGTTDETRCPYDDELLSLVEARPRSKQYFYDMTPGNSDERKRNRNSDGGPRKKPRPEFDQSKCWFCLASPDVEKHLVVCVGDHAYLAVARGGLAERHLLILPIEHYQTSLELPDEVAEEIKKFKEAITLYFEDDEQVPVFFERNYKTAHLQVQAVPVPYNKATNVKMALQDEAESQGYAFDELEPPCRIEQVIPEGAPFFLVDVPSGETMHFRCRSGFPVNFGRTALCSSGVLNVKGRETWQQCALSREEEQQLTKRVRKEFEQFDFTS